MAHVKYFEIIFRSASIASDLLCVLLKALPPVCMKYTAQGESRVANIAQGKVECYICHETLTKSCILSYKRRGSALSVLLYLNLRMC